MKKKAIVIFIGVFLSLYFLFIIVIQIHNQNYFESHPIIKISNKYTSPYFEQNWSMFSPVPPMGNRFFLIKFETNKFESNFIDINKIVREKSFKGLFSIDQRILKYFSECYNDISAKKNIGLDIENNIHLSHGLESIISYSKIVLSRQTEFLEKLNPSDSVFIKIYLNENHLNPYSMSNGFTKTYLELDKILLLDGNGQ